MPWRMLFWFGDKSSELGGLRVCGQLTYFVHAILVTRHLMGQGHAAAQVRRALRGPRLLRRGSRRGTRAEIDPQCRARV